MAAFRDTQNSADAAGEKEKEIEAIKRERDCIASGSGFGVGARESG